ncbi:PP2C family protein-serine/threonine phosphatase [Nocardioides sp.]|uniref:PP2C family protein-serine/threonine phosphatase n=1 Tax=Nocardioides sp. TaxID=35761 RepID=UPI003D10251C
MGNPTTGYLQARVALWRTGTRKSQQQVARALMVVISASFVVSVAAPEWMPLAAYFVWLLIAMLLLRFRWLVVVGAVNALAGVLAVALNGPITASRVIAMVAFVVAVLLVLLVASRQRSGLPAMLSEAFLVDLRDRLQAQGKIPPLPEGWESQSAMIASHGVTYAGDFLVADLSEDRTRFELILVDVCGKGTGAGPAALQFSGALGGLIGALPPQDLLRAANDFLIRQGDDEAFATAVHLLVDLEEGRYQITSGGHPPALRWDLASQEWTIDNACGTALGVLNSPELHVSEGRLHPGEALMFYTDGVVEARGSSIDAGIAWLQRVALEAVGQGFGGAANRIVGQVESGEDDRAVLILSRTPVGSRAIDETSVS